jgi:hypothetical protein
MLAMSDSLKHGVLNASFGFGNITKKKVKHYTPPIAATLHNNPQKQFEMQGDRCRCFLPSSWLLLFASSQHVLVTCDPARLPQPYQDGIETALTQAYCQNIHLNSSCTTVQDEELALCEPLS